MKYRFSGHQTFAFRYGWLEKGVNAISTSPDTFSADDAIVQLGVGKNMVESIRHWCLATQMLEETFDPSDTKSRILKPSAFAAHLLLKDGWDPFLENDASLWLIHWLLVSNPHIGTSWQLAFGHFHRPDFSKRELIDFVKAFADKRSIRVGESSLARDVDCFLRTYVPVRNGGRAEIAEETFDCPLQELGVIQASQDGEFFRFAIGPKPSLPAAVFVFALNEYFAVSNSERNTMSVQECLYGLTNGPQSPGQAFKLDENSLIEYIETIEDMTSGALVLDETAGLKQIYRRQNLDSMQLLETFYRGVNR
jgi:hypothetical protein